MLKSSTRRLILPDAPNICIDRVVLSPEYACALSNSTRWGRDLHNEWSSEQHGRPSNETIKGISGRLVAIAHHRMWIRTWIISWHSNTIAPYRVYWSPLEVAFSFYYERFIVFISSSSVNFRENRRILYICVSVCKCLGPHSE